jgi:two-component system response regulator FixJ
VREALTFQLRTAGFAVATYSSTEALLEASDAEELDCVVADIYLPKMNRGSSFRRRLNPLFPTHRSFFIAGHGDLSLGMHAMRTGAVDFLEAG